MRIPRGTPSSSHPRSLGCIGTIGLVTLGVLGAGLLYNAPSVRWRVAVTQARVRDTLFPHPDTLPTPSIALAEQPTITLPTFTPPQTSTPLPIEETTGPVVSAAASPTTPPPTVPISPTTRRLTEDLPPSAQLTGVVHEYQRWNNCGPATLAMGLSFWGWQGTQTETAAFLKPDPDDKNVRPDEMAAYVETTGLHAITRVGGTVDALRRFVANGLPVIVEKGFWVDEDRGWMGHYVLVTGYDDESRLFATQDSFKGPNQRVGYNALLSDWQAFNYLYIVIYPDYRAVEVLALFGPDADETTNVVNALAPAQNETESAATNQAKAFAWFNAGTNLNALGRYADAAAAFDQARWLGLPWRMLWYQTGPYRAYYNAGRYQDVIDLADATLAVVDDLEESYYWRGLTRQALGDIEGATADFKAAHKYNANFEAAGEALARLGVEH